MQMTMYVIAAMVNFILSIVLIMIIRKKSEMPTERKCSLIIFSIIAPMLVLILFGKQLKTEI